MITSKHWGYFNGSKKHPVPDNEQHPMDMEIRAAECWESEDQVAHYLLTQQIPDLTAMEASQYNTAKEQWNMVKQEYTVKSKYAKNDLKQAFLEMQCPKGGDVCTFLMSLRTKHNELTAAGIAIPERDFQWTVL
jgi:hypothetical protein